MTRKIYTITPLTGIHIGTGEELTPLDYTITDKIGNTTISKSAYCKFSCDRILQRLMNDNKASSDFYNASVEGNMKDLQKFFQDHCTSMDDVDYLCEVTKGFAEIYNEICNKDYNPKAGRVYQMYHTEEINNKMKVPAIPGTSIKGSIRTALLNYFLAGLSESEYDDAMNEINVFEQKKDLTGGENNLKQKLLEYSDAKNDPFRAISLSDCSFKDIRTQLVGCLKVVYFYKESLNPLKINIQAEVIRGELLGGNAKSEVCISIDDKLQKMPFAPNKDETPRRLKTIDFDDIRDSCNYFYWREFGEFEREYDKFYRNVSDGTEDLIVKLRKELKKAIDDTKKQFIIRVGRWSQVEYVTFGKDFRKPVIKKGKKDDKPPKWGTTRTLFDYNGSYLPMGWCVLKEKEE
jgi:CRISPR-associated protein Csm5